MATIASMTPEDLKKFVEDRIDERLSRFLGTFELSEDHNDALSWDEVRASVEQHRWTPPSGAKSSLELLREDRDS
ncbi:MAG: hypothetical protein ABI700_28890 [Chloroflexota bacterium]